MNAPTERTLLSQKALYEDLFNRLKDWIFLLDAESYKVLEVNFACEQSYGIPAQEFADKLMTQWVDGAEHNEFQKAMRMAKRRYYPRTIEHHFVGPSGKMIEVEVNICPLRISDGQELLQVIVHDITFRREAERKIQELVTQLQGANAKLEQLSTHDEMTGLFNFRHFKSMLQAEHQRAQRFKTPYSLIFFDIDYFKKYNDRNGHPAGDRLLKKFATIVMSTCRTMDFPCRYGGEEFVIICPNSSKTGALTLAERVRTSIESMQFEFSEFQPSGKVTVSSGVSTYPDDADAPELVLKAADKAVYYSKDHGRNQVTAASPLLPSESNGSDKSNESNKPD